MRPTVCHQDHRPDRVRRRTGRRVGAIAAGLSLVLAAACGGDDDGDVATDAPPVPTGESDDGDDATSDETTAPSDGDDAAAGGDMDDAAFCARMEAMEDEFGDDDDLDPEAFAALAALAASAPDPGVRDALERFGELAQELDGLDEDDPAAFGIALGLMFDPEFIASMEAMERYMVDVCGFDESEWGMDGGFDDGFDAGAEIPYDEDAWDAVFDDLSVVRDPIEAELGSLRGFGVFSGMGAPTVTVDIDPSQVDPLEACEIVADIWDAALSADGLPVEINDDDFEIVAERPAGGVCAQR